MFGPSKHIVLHDLIVSKNRLAKHLPYLACAKHASGLQQVFKTFQILDIRHLSGSPTTLHSESALRHDLPHTGLVNGLSKKTTPPNPYRS